MKKLNLFYIVVFILLIPASGCSAGGPWKGKVVDAETKQPIEGAAVVAVWEKEVRLDPAGAHQYNIDAIETVTDKNGDFRIPKKRYISIPFIREIKGPWFTIFKPGYGDFGHHVVIQPAIKVVPGLPFYSGYNPEDFFEEKNNVVIGFKKWKTAEERKRNLPDPFFTDISNKKIKFLIKAINEERKELNLPIYSED